MTHLVGLGRTKISDDDIVALYRSGLTYRKIADRYAVSMGRIKRALVAAGVEIRSQPLTRAQIDNIVERYVVLEQSAYAIGKELDRPPTTIVNALNREGVQMRQGRNAHTRKC